MGCAAWPLSTAEALTGHSSTEPLANPTTKFRSSTNWRSVTLQPTVLSRSKAGSLTAVASAVSPGKREEEEEEEREGGNCQRQRRLT